jgi:hypothetical protein
VALIHDLEYHEGGDKAEFRASNHRFYVNGKKAACAMYAWYDPRRMYVIGKAWQFQLLCNWRGWEGWGK